MKKLIFIYLLIGVFTFSIQSCRKDRDNIKYVVLNETIHSGDIYALNLSSYGDVDDISTISQQAKNYGVSQLDKDPVTNQSIYHFSFVSKLPDIEKIQLIVSEVHHDGRGDCGHGHKTIITINLNIIQ